MRQAEAETVHLTTEPPSFDPAERSLLAEAGRNHVQAVDLAARLRSQLAEAEAAVTRTMWYAQGTVGSLLRLHGETASQWTWRYDADRDEMLITPAIAYVLAPERPEGANDNGNR